MDTLHNKIKSLEARLEKLEQFRLIAGDGIRIAETGDHSLLIEAEEQEPLTDEVREWILDTDHKLAMLELNSNLNHAPPYRSQKNIAAAETDYSNPLRIRDFPFRVRIRGEAGRAGEPTEVVVCGGNTCGGSFVFAGLDNPIPVSGKSFTITGPCRIYLKIEAEESTGSDETAALSAVLEAGTPPGQSPGRYVVTLASVEYATTGRAVVHQIQFGHIHIAGRIV